MEKGLIHLYIGDGKGKTTAAVGLCVRMAGAGGHVLFFQFLKDGQSNEIQGLGKLGIQTGHAPKVDKFTWQMNEQELAQCKAMAKECFQRIQKDIQQGIYDLVVLDEILDAVNCHMLEDNDLQQLLDCKAESTEIVLTGRNPSLALQERCDYISEIKCVKHPYQKGITARPGVEY